jgi:hypothetical protein
MRKVSCAIGWTLLANDPFMYILVGLSLLDRKQLANYLVTTILLISEHPATTDHVG